MEAKRLERYQRLLYGDAPLIGDCRWRDIVIWLREGPLIGTLLGGWPWRTTMEWLRDAPPIGGWLLRKTVGWLMNAPLIGGWLLRKTVERLMNDGTPEAVRVLEEAAAHNDDEQSQFKIVTALRRLAEQGNAEAQEELCRLTIFHDLPLARETALALSCAPRDASHRTLFYFLTGQWDQYERLDFDHSLLRGAYNAGDEKLRQRIGERARGAGRVEWVEVVVGGRQGRQLGALTDSEWEVTLEVLSGSGRWAEMWRLAQEAPARWGARLLQRLSVTGWVPEGDAVRAEYEELAMLAGEFTDAGFDSLSWRRAVLEVDNGPVDCLAISPDGRMLASGGSYNSFDYVVRLWNLPDGAPLRMLECGRRISCLAISPDGRMLAVGEMDHPVVQLWSLPDGAPLKALNGKAHWGWCNERTDCIAFSPDGRILVSGDHKEFPDKWWQDMSPMEREKFDRLIVYSLAYSPDGSVLASWGHDCLERSRLLDGAHLEMGNNRPLIYVHRLAISPDGITLAGCSLDRAYLWSQPDGAPLRTLTGHEGEITSLAFRPDGRILASGGKDSTVRLWSVPDGAPLKILKVDSRGISCVAFSPDGKTLAIACLDKVVRFWNLNPFYQIPISQTSVGDMVWAQETLRNGDLNAEQRNCLEFIAALIRLRRKFDIQLGEPTRRIEAGEFDIEIEG